MISNNAYLYLEDKKLKKTDKIDSCFKKMILIKYRDYLIYCLYDRKSNLIFVLCSIDVNESSMLKNLTTAEVYEVESSIAELIKFDKSFTVKLIKFDEFFTLKSHEIKSSAADESINKPIFKHM